MMAVAGNLVGARGVIQAIHPGSMVATVPIIVVETIPGGKVGRGPILRVAAIARTYENNHTPGRQTDRHREQHRLHWGPYRPFATPPHCIPTTRPDSIHLLMLRDSWAPVMHW